MSQVAATSDFEPTSDEPAIEMIEKLLGGNDESSSTGSEAGGDDAPGSDGGLSDDEQPESTETDEDAETEETDEAAREDESEEALSAVVQLGEALGVDPEKVKARAKVFGVGEMRKYLETIRDDILAQGEGGKPSEEAKAPAQEQAKPEDLSKYISAIGDEEWRANFLDNNPDAEPLLNAFAALSKRLDAIDGETKGIKTFAEQAQIERNQQLVSDLEEFYDAAWKAGDRRFGPAGAIRLSDAAAANRQKLGKLATWTIKTDGVRLGTALKRASAMLPQDKKAEPKAKPQAQQAPARTPPSGRAASTDRGAKLYERDIQRRDAEAIAFIEKSGLFPKGRR